MSAIDRSLPHSIEAEENLLSCCLLEGADTVDRCREAKIEPGVGRSMYVAAHGMILEVIYDIHDRGIPIGADTVAEELKCRKDCPSDVGTWLDAVGGYAFLAKVSSKIPTTATATYFIDTVGDYAMRRRAIRLATDTIEDCHNLPDGCKVAELAGRIEGRFAAVSGNTRGGMLAKIEAARLNPDVEPPPLRVVFTVGGICVATPGNLVAVCAQAKAGKTAFIGACIGSTFTDSRDCDFLGVAGFNRHGHAVVHLDTEQAPADHWGIIATAKRRADIATAPAWLRSYATAGWSARERRSALPQMLRLAKRQCGGVHAAFIDGVADFIDDPNAGDEVFPFVDEIRALSVQYDCPIFTVLHLNPGTEKGRGHLGSQLERRAETNLVLDKDVETGRTVIYSTKQRRAPILKADGPCFRWDVGAGFHVSCATAGSLREADALADLRNLADEVFEGGRLRYVDACQRIEKARRVGEKAGEKWFTRMKKANVIRNAGLGLWEVITP